MGKVAGIRTAARYRQSEREVRLLRISQHLHGLPGARLRRQRRFPGRGAVLHLSAASGREGQRDQGFTPGGAVRKIAGERGTGPSANASATPHPSAVFLNFTAETQRALRV